MSIVSIDDAETVTVVVHPTGSELGRLTVADAMQQVADIFSLLRKADSILKGQEYEWRLESATTNSPFTVSAVAVPTGPRDNGLRLAAFAKSRFQEGWESFLSDDARPFWIDEEAETIVQRLVRRSLNGIGRTDIKLKNHQPPLVIDHESAVKVQTTLSKHLVLELESDSLRRTEFGSVEGTIVGVVSYYGKPAIAVKDWLSDRIIKCVPHTDEIRDRINEEHRFRDAWTNQRVIVTGVIHYNPSGQMLRMDVDEIERLNARLISFDELRAGTVGSDTKDYLNWGNRDED
jgi:hypothetical protein